MARFYALRSALLRPLLGQQHQLFFPISPRCSSTSISPLIPPPASAQLITLSIPTAFSLFSPHSICSRSYSSDSEVPSNMVLVKSEDQLNDSLHKVGDKSSSAVLYFTAVWCGPCRFLWPDVKKLSESLPDVTFYKIDIDEVGEAISKLDVFSVPTLHFYKNGKKAAEVVGADAKRIKDISSELYK